MRFFCYDSHIAVIEDFKAACPQIEVVDWTTSGVSAILSKPLAHPKHINLNTWGHLNMNMVQLFQREYDDILRTFDGFVVGYLSGYALIYEKYNKPVIMINACRYDIPFCFSGDTSMLSLFHKCLYRLHNKGLLWIVSNNKCDQSYTAKGLGLMSRYIPTLGTYAGIKYAPSKPTFLCYKQGHEQIEHPLIVFKKDVDKGNPLSMPWSEFGTYKGIIHFPYEPGLTMSMFEHFSGGCPMFFPSRAFWKTMPYIISTTQYWKKFPSNLSEFAREDHWIDTTCLYDVFKSPNTHIFDSMEHLYQLLETFVYIPEDRTARNNAIKKQWADLLAELPRDKTVQIRYGRNPLS